MVVIVTFVGFVRLVSVAFVLVVRLDMAAFIELSRLESAALIALVTLFSEELTDDMTLERSLFKLLTPDIILESSLFRPDRTFLLSELRSFSPETTLETFLFRLFTPEASLETRPLKPDMTRLLLVSLTPDRKSLTPDSRLFLPLELRIPLRPRNASLRPLTAPPTELSPLIRLAIAPIALLIPSTLPFRSPRKLELKALLRSWTVPLRESTRESNLLTELPTLVKFRPILLSTSLIVAPATFRRLA